MAEERNRESFRVTEMLLLTGKPRKGRGYSDKAEMSPGFESQMMFADVGVLMSCPGIWELGTNLEKRSAGYPPAVVE